MSSVNPSTSLQRPRAVAGRAWQRWGLVLCVALLNACAHHPTRAPASSTAVEVPAPAATPTPNSPPSLVIKPTLPDATSRPTDAQLMAMPDPVVRYEPKARLGNPPSYVALGQRYVVLSSSKGYVERGVASWYGPNFHGALASVGEPYNMYALTGAHRVLPLPCYARVTNLKNGRSVVVRLNDRGPFKDNRIVDLSYAAALKLDMLREGTAFVELRVLEPSDGASSPAAVNAANTQTLNWYAQVGAFGEKANALRVKQNLDQAHLTGTAIVEERSGERNLWKVRVGPVDSVGAYDQLVQQLHSVGITTITLVDGQRLSNRSPH